MGFDMGGVFGKLSSSKIDISDFDFSSPVRKTTKTKERYSGSLKQKNDLFAFFCDFDAYVSTNYF